MKIITYNERSSFYNNEVRKSYRDICLLKDIKGKYGIGTSIFCPCASGIYLEEFSKLFSYSYFIDIEEKMVECVNKKLTAKNIDNVMAYVHNLIYLNQLNIESDCIFVLNQGIQYLNKKEFLMFLDNSYKITRYIVLSIFDFESNGYLSYYDSRIQDEVYYLSKMFKIKNTIYRRYNKHSHEKNCINITYKYFVNDGFKFKTNFKLYNYKYEEIIKINQKYSIVDKKIYDNGECIIVLKRR